MKYLSVVPLLFSKLKIHKTCDKKATAIVKKVYNCEISGPSNNEKDKEYKNMKKYLKNKIKNWKENLIISRS